MMKRALTMAAAIWLASFGEGFAQGTLTSGMGVTSPLGTLGSQASSQSPAIPLGATELDINGVSPLMMPCSGSAASNSAFDGGGSPSGSITDCGSSTSAGSSGAAGSASVDSATSAQTLGSAGGAGIPLGSTGLGTPGESPTIAIPAPGVSTSSCSGGLGTTLGTSAASGLAPTSSC